jgi:hypothetical protein
MLSSEAMEDNKDKAMKPLIRDEQLLLPTLYAQ